MNYRYEHFRAKLLAADSDVAKRDVLGQAPPMYAMARLAAGLRPLPELARGALAQMVVMGVTAASAAAIVRAVRRRR